MDRRITLIIGGLRGGGAQRVCVTLANALVKRGYAVDLVVLGLEDAAMLASLSDQVTLIDLGVDHARKSFFALAEYIKRANPKTVLSFNREISIILGFLRLLYSFDFRLISRNITYLSLSESAKKGIWFGVIVNFMIRKFYGFSDLFIAQSKGMAEDLESYLGVNKKKVLVINNPISENIEYFLKNNDITNLNKEDYLLCIGRLDEVKAFHYAIEAFSNLAEKYPLLKLKIVGKGSLEGELRKLATARGVAERVLFEGYQDNIISYYLHARITVLTSLYEGFPNALIESIALGTPVVAFDCPSGPSEIIKNGVNGYMVRYRDLNHLVECLEKALNKEWDITAVRSSADRFKSTLITQEYIDVINSHSGRLKNNI